MNRVHGRDPSRATDTRRHAATPAAGSSPDPMPHGRLGWHTAAAARLLCEPLEPRMVLAANPLVALVEVSEPVSLDGDPAGAAAAHTITLDRGGYLDVSLVAAAGGVPGDRQLQLRDKAGTLVATSVEGPKGVKLSQYLPAGDYALSLAAPRGAVGTCTIVATAAEPPGPLTLGAFPGDARPDAVTIATLGRDGRGPVGVVVSDTLHKEVAVYEDLPDAQGLPSGRFRKVFAHAIGDLAWGGMAIGDVDGDGVADMIVTSSDYTTVTTTLEVLHGEGDGTFVPARSLPVAGLAVGLQLADVDRDGRRDVVLLTTDGDFQSTTIDILWNVAGQGIMAEAAWHEQIAGTPFAVVVGDFNGDHRPDIAVGGLAEDSQSPGRVSVWYGPAKSRDQRSWQAAPGIPLAAAPYRLAATDLDLDGCDEVGAICQRFDPELGTANGGSLVVLAGSPRGLVAPNAPQALPSVPQGITTGDVDGDGYPDVVVALDAGAVGVLRGDGRGRLAWAGEHAVGSQAYAVALGDIDADGRPDIVSADYGSGTATILRQRPDGSYQGRPQDGGDTAVVAIDVNGDGRVDTITRSYQDHAVSVRLGRGDGTFQAGGRYEVGNSLDVGMKQVLIAVADINGDGRPDIVTANQASRSITLVLGFGDGSFGRRVDLAIADQPTAVVVRDVDGDGSADIVVTTGVNTMGAVTVLWGERGRLDFADRTTPLPVGLWPRSVSVADVDADGRNDLVVADRGDPWADKPGGLSVLLGDGTRRFAAPLSIGGSGAGPESAGSTLTVFGASVVDAARDGRPAVVMTVSRSDGNFLIVLGGFAGDHFTRRREISLGGSSFPTAPVTADVDGDGWIDTIVGLSSDAGVQGTVAVFSGRDPSTSPTTATVPLVPNALAVADLDADGRLDVLALVGSSRLVALMSQPDKSLAQAGAGTFVDQRTNRVVPLVAVDGGRSGSVTLDRTGAIVVRLDGGDRPVVVAGATAFDIAAIRTSAGRIAVAAIDADRGGISLYDVMPDGTLGRRRPVPRPDGAAPVFSRIHGFDIDRDGNDDIVVSDPGTGSMRVLLAGRGGVFASDGWRSFTAGAGVSEFALADVNGDGRVDLVAAGQVSGDVSVRHGLPVAAEGSGTAIFGPERRLRATVRDAAFAQDRYSGRATPVSPTAIDGVAVVDMDGDSRPDIVVASAADGSVAVLRGLPGGGFAEPQVHYPRSVAAPGPLLVTRAVEPRDLATGDFDGDGRTDVAILDRATEQVLVYLSGENAGVLDLSGLPTTTIPLAGNAATTLATADRDGPGGRSDGVLDLLVGNDYGDVLLLRGEADARGRGTGRFGQRVRADGGVALVAADIDGDGRTDFVYGSRSLDRIVVNTAANARIFAADQTAGVIGPSAVKTVKERVGGGELTNLLVANGAGNELLVFARSAGGGEAFLPPRRFFVGTNPTAIATGDFNRDGITDVAVANGGSNDVSILLGASGSDGRWTLVAGPRLALGGLQPTGLAVGDFAMIGGGGGADGIPDIAVTTAAGGVAVVPGVGGGYFADNSLQQLSVGAASAPVAIFAVARGPAAPATIVVVNAGTSTVSTFDAGQGFARTDIPSGGLAPRAAAVHAQGSTTALAVANGGTGNVSIFLASPASLTSSGGLSFAAIASSPFANASSLAFDSTGQLFGTAGANESPLALYSFSQAAMTPSMSAGSLRALINFLPSQLSGVGLVATLVTSAGIPVAEESSGDGQAAAGRGTGGRAGDTESLGAEGEPADPVADDASRTKEDVAEAEAAPLLRFFLDLEAALEDTNAQLLETLLSRAGDGLDTVRLAGRVARRNAEPPREQPPVEQTTEPTKSAQATARAAGMAAAEAAQWSHSVEAVHREAFFAEASAAVGGRPESAMESRVVAGIDPLALARLGTFAPASLRRSRDSRGATWPPIVPSHAEAVMPSGRSAATPRSHPAIGIARDPDARPRPAADGAAAASVPPSTPAAHAGNPGSPIVSLLQAVWSKASAEP